MLIGKKAVSAVIVSFCLGLVVGVLFMGAPPTPSTKLSHFKDRNSTLLTPPLSRKNSSAELVDTTENNSDYSFLRAEQQKLLKFTQAVFARYRPPLVSSVDLKISESVVQDLQLSPEQKEQVGYALEQLMQKVIESEKANLSVEVDSEGSQFLNIKKYDGRILADEFSASLRGKLDNTQIDIINSLLAETLTFGMLGRADLKISASEITTNLPAGSEYEPVAVSYEFRDADNSLQTTTFTLSKKAYVERYGPLLLK